MMSTPSSSGSGSPETMYAASDTGTVLYAHFLPSLSSSDSSEASLRNSDTDDMYMDTGSQEVAGPREGLYAYAQPRCSQLPTEGEDHNIQP